MNAVAMRETHPVTPSETGRVLIADDQMHVLDALQMLLSGCGLATEAVTHPARVLRALETGQFDAVLMDLNYARDTVSGGEALGESGPSAKIARPTFVGTCAAAGATAARRRTEGGPRDSGKSAAQEIA